MYIEIQWMTDSIDEARSIAECLVQQKLVACANIIPNVESIYIWEGKIESSQELKVLFKTQDTLFEKIKTIIEEKCSYDVPAILKFEVADGNTNYLAWIKTTCS